MKQIIYSFIFLLSFTACKEDRSKIFSAQLDIIDKQLVALDSALNKFCRIDSAQATGLVSEYNEVAKVIKKYYALDQKGGGIDQEFGSKAKTYKALKKSGDYAKLRKQYLKEATYTKQQLIDLKDEIINGTSNEDEIAEYLTLETKGVNVITKVLKDYTLYVNNQISIYDSLHPYMRNIADSLIRVYEPTDE